jgi:hypothetical protein
MTGSCPNRGKKTILARSGEDLVRQSQFREDGRNRGTIRLEPRRQNEELAERRPMLIHGETGTISCQFEKHTTRLAEVPPVRFFEIKPNCLNVYVTKLYECQ